MKDSSLDFKIKDFEKKQKTIILIVLLVFCGVSVIVNNLYLTALAQESTNYLSRFIEIGDQREVTLVLQQAHLKNYKVIRYNSKNNGNSFVIPAKTFIDDENNIYRSLIYDSVETPIISNISTQKSDVIVYEFNRFKFTPYAFLAWIIMLLILIPQTQALKKKLTEQFIKDLEFEKKSSKAEIAKQVRHNLRTPLAALMRIPHKLPSNAANEKELLQITINQIQELIQKLDIEDRSAQSKNIERNIFDTLLASRQELNLIISKNIDFSFTIEDAISSNLAEHIPAELRSILSNMVNNSIEAISGHGKIVLQALDKGAELEIKISDDGAGIPYEVQNKIFNKSFSHNKPKGSGIGLAHAKEFIDQWNGTICVESTAGLGTTFTIRLPIAEKESWYLPRIKIDKTSKIYILDDQDSALALWKQKLSDKLLLDRSTFYKKPSEFLSELLGKLLSDKNLSDQSLFLIDYDLGLDINGIDILKQLPANSFRCLVTGHFDDINIRQLCLDNGFYLLPKSQIASLPIV